MAQGTGLGIKLAIFDVDGVRVAVIGASPNELYATTTGAGLKGNEVLDEVAKATQTAAELQARAFVEQLQTESAAPAAAETEVDPFA